MRRLKGSSSNLLSGALMWAFLLLLLPCLIHTAPATEEPTEEEGDSHIKIAAPVEDGPPILVPSKRELELEVIVENRASAMTWEKFAHDPILLQAHPVTQYIYPKSKPIKNRVILQKRNPDAGKEAIVLLSSDTSFAIPTPRGGKKRQFVLLKRAQVGAYMKDMIPYHASFVFVRDQLPSDTDNDAVEVMGTKVVIEFDMWEQRPRKFYAGWKSCDYSMMFTCTSFSKMFQDVIGNKAKARRRRRKRDLSNNAIIHPHAIVKRDADEDESAPLSPIVSAEGYEPSDYNDLYLDLDFHRFDEILKVKKTGTGTARRKRSARGQAGGGAGTGAKKGFMSGIFKKVFNTGKNIFETGTGIIKDTVKAGTGAGANLITGLTGWIPGVSIVGDMAAGILNNAGSLVAAGVEVVEDLTHAGAGLIANVAETGLGMLDSIVGLDEEGGIGGILGGVLKLGGGGGLEGMLGGIFGGGADGGISGLVGGILGGEVEAEIQLGVEAEAEVAAGPRGRTLGDDFVVPGSEGEASASADTGAKPNMGANLDVLANLLKVVANAGAHDGKGSDLKGNAKALAVLQKIFGKPNIDQKQLGTVVESGEGIVSPWDTVNHGLVEAGAAVYIKEGVSPGWAKLAALGAQMSVNSRNLVGNLELASYRVGGSVAGSLMNGADFNGKGFEGDDAMPSNGPLLFGNIYPGGENGKQFFLPEGSILPSKLITDDGEEINGFFKSEVPGKPDAFFPYDDEAASKFIGKRGRIVMDSYKPTVATAEAGIFGTLSVGYTFQVEGLKVKAIYNPTQSSEHLWAPPELKAATSSRPLKTSEDRKIFYGYLFAGVPGSPNIFVPEGDTLSGFFVADDLDHPEVKEFPHGVLIPNHPAGHATFTPEYPAGLEYMKNVKGVFVPDAMDLQGGIGGRIVKSRMGSGMPVFSFVLDIPAIDFTYVSGAANTKNVWCSLIRPEEWKYVPPQMSEESGNGNSRRRRKREAGAGAEGQTNSQFGVLVETSKTVAFIPQDYAIEGVLLLVDNDTKLDPCEGELTMTNPKEPLKIKITKKAEGVDQISGKVVGLFVPYLYASMDAISGEFTFNDDKSEGTLQLSEKLQGHFWTPKQDVWTPAGFVQKVSGDEAQMAEAKSAAKAESEGKFTAKTSTAILGIFHDIPKAPMLLPNYKFGHNFKAKPQMKENIVDKLPHQYLYGSYFKSKSSPESVFIPETGAYGIFVPDKSSGVKAASKAYYFAEKAELPASFILEIAGSVPDGTFGRFYVLNNDGKKSRGFIRGTYAAGVLNNKEGLEGAAGWKQMNTLQVIDPAKVPDDKKAHLKPSKKTLAYALIDVGGGHKGVVVEGAESLDDPNCPIFQQYLHYRAQLSGDVNPWGQIVIVDPIVRPAVAVQGSSDEGIFGGLKRLALGVLSSGWSLYSPVLLAFSLTNWEYPFATEVGDKLGPMKFGAKTNVVSMMDYRMYLMRKYSCKRAQINGKVVKLFVPRSAEPFLDVVKIAKPRDAWLEAVKSSGKGWVNPLEEGVVGAFTSMFYLPIDLLSPFSRLIGTSIPKLDSEGTYEEKKDTGDWKTTAQFDEFGDETSCDEIILDAFNEAQVLVGSSSNMSGMDLGLQLVEGISAGTDFKIIARKLLDAYEEKKANAGQSKAEINANLKEHAEGTDLLGGINAKLEAKGRTMPDTKPEKECSKEKDTKKMGRSFLDEEEDPEESTRDHAKILPGWKTQFKTLEPNATIPPEGVIFYGFGNCEMTNVPDKGLLESKKPDEIIKYYLQVLRTDCMEHSVKRITSLINQKYLELSEDMTFFEIPDENKITNEKRITPTETKKLSQAFEFQAFTKVYQKIFKKGESSGTGLVNEPHATITRSTRLLTELSFYIVDNAHVVAPTHSVKLIRNLLRSLRTVMTKLHQDSIALEGCDACVIDKLITNGDKFRIVSLIQFIIHGLGPVVKEGKNIEATFNEFVELNKPALEQRVREFERQFPTK